MSEEIIQYKQAEEAQKDLMAQNIDLLRRLSQVIIPDDFDPPV
jgi:hypothetical protein